MSEIYWFNHALQFPLLGLIQLLPLLGTWALLWLREHPLTVPLGRLVAVAELALVVLLYTEIDARSAVLQFAECNDLIGPFAYHAGADGLTVLFLLITALITVLISLYGLVRGLADPDRLVIRGSSAGGLTTLCALTFHDVFKAGASYYGVSDLKGLDADSHKFESHYNEYLIAPKPESEALYLLRSPINHTAQLKRPMIFFQGLDDKVVPPQQSSMMVDALRASGVPVAYMTLEGEGHGFRKADSIVRTLEAELYFYQRIFGLAAPGAPAPVEIENMPGTE